MDLEVRHLRLVRAVASSGGLTAAGRELHLTQSALSHQLRDVETRLGTPLFLRVGKRMVLTTAGERLLRSADEILVTLERTEEAIRGLAGSRRGRLRVSTGGYTEYHWLPPVLRAFREACPQVDLQIVAAVNGNAAEMLIGGHIDIAIVDRRVNDARLVARALFEDEVIAIAAPGHPLAAKRFVRPEDFIDQTLILESPAPQHAVYQRFLETPRVVPASIQVVPQTSVMFELVKAGLGVALVARWAVEPLIKSGEVRPLRLGQRGERHRWNALLLKDLAEVTYVQDFLIVIMKVFNRTIHDNMRHNTGSPLKEQ